MRDEYNTLKKLKKQCEENIKIILTILF